MSNVDIGVALVAMSCSIILTTLGFYLGMWFFARPGKYNRRLGDRE